MAIPLPTDAVIDYLSITHRNIYRLPITPDQRCIIKKYLRLIENDIDETEESPGRDHHLTTCMWGNYRGNPKYQASGAFTCGLLFRESNLAPNY